MKLIKLINRYFQLQALTDALATYPKLTIESANVVSFNDINEICDLQGKILTLKSEAL